MYFNLYLILNFQRHRYYRLLHYCRLHDSKLVETTGTVYIYIRIDVLVGKKTI